MGRITERQIVILCIIALILLNIGVYGIWIDQLGLYEDDWKLIVVPATSLKRLISNWLTVLRSQRPLDGASLAIMAIVLRTAGLLAARITLILPHLMASLILFLFLRRISFGQIWLSFLGAAIFTVYPTGTSHLAWLTGFNYSMALLFTILALWGFIESTLVAGRKRLWFLIASLECYLISILLIETDVLVVPGFVVLWSLWRHAGQIFSDQSMLRKVRLAVRTSIPYLSVLAAYFIWWTKLVPLYGGHEKSGMLDLSTGSIIWRLLKRLQTSFLFPFPVFAKLKFLDWQEIVFLVLLVFMGVMLVGLRISSIESGKSAVNSRLERLRLYIWLAGLGIVMATLSYLPWSLLSDWMYVPTILGLESRPNYGASVGSAIAVTSGLGILARLVGWRWLRIGRAVAIVLAASVLSFSAAFHYANQKDFASSWRHQKNLYSGIQQQCPGLAPGTVILVDGIGRVDWNKGDYVITLWWLSNIALRMLYSDPSIQANQVQGATLGVPEFQLDGFYLFVFPLGQKFLWYSYDRVIFFHYDRNTGQVSKMNNYWALNSNGELLNLKSNWENCQNQPVVDTPERQFVLSLLKLIPE